MKHALDTLRDGITGFSGAASHPVPLRATAIEVEALAGLAIVRVSRTFRNDEADPIEAVMTFPVPFDAVLTGMSIEIDGRKLAAAASPREAARATYEAALDRGKTAVLHEEALQGLHVLSVGQLGPSKEAVVAIEFVAPMAPGKTGARLRIPMTVGQMYGRSPFLPADDILTSPDAKHPATITVRGAAALLSGIRLGDGPAPADLDRAVELVFPETSFGAVEGRSADGRTVSVTMKPCSGDEDLDVAVLFDTSGSMNDRFVPNAPKSKWQACQEGFRAAVSGLRASDAIAVRHFQNFSRLIGQGKGPERAVELASKIPTPSGGTRLGQAVIEAAGDGRDILVLTDGQTFANEAQRVGELGRRVSAVLIGSEALEAMVGQLVKLTGGQLFVADPDDVAGALTRAMASLRVPGRGTQGVASGGKPAKATCIRGGVEILATWSVGSGEGADPVGRFAAAIAMPLLSVEEATDLAVAHGLCTHLTSLVVVDEAGEANQGVPAMRKVALQASSAVAFSSDLSMRCMAAPKELLRAMPLGSSGADPEWLSVDASFGSIQKKPSGGLTRSRMPKVDAFDAMAPLGDLSGLTMQPAAVAAAVPWGKLAPELARGDLSNLAAWIRDEVTKIAALPEVAALAKSVGVTPVAAALAVLARLVPGDRAAARIARKILAAADGALLQAAAVAADGVAAP